MFLSGCWVLFSDLLLDSFFGESQNLLFVQTAKGLIFVVLSGVAIFALVHREERRLASTNEELERALQHAMVLHRLLRHNLRNSCDVIQNNVDLLESGRGDAAENRARIQRQVTRLATIATKSQHLRDVVFDEGTEPIEQDLRAVVEEAVEGARERFPQASFVVTDAEPRRVLAHPRLSIAIGEVLANAVVHQDACAPVVTVSVERDGPSAVVRVEDDGPGIPEVERVVLEGGVEDALTHSRGVGLWVVRFIVAASGGSLSVPSTGSDGTVVCIRLPAVDE